MGTFRAALDGLRRTGVETDELGASGLEAGGLVAGNSETGDGGGNMSECWSAE